MKYAEINKMEKWFDNSNSEICRKHREAYEKSLKSNHAVKVQEGSYYYKGYEVANDGSKDFPWNYKLPTEITSDCVKTKKEALETIDYILNNQK